MSEIFNNKKVMEDIMKAYEIASCNDCYWANNLKSTFEVRRKCTECIVPPEKRNRTEAMNNAAKNRTINK